MNLPDQNQGQVGRQRSHLLLPILAAVSALVTNAASTITPLALPESWVKTPWLPWVTLALVGLGAVLTFALAYVSQNPPPDLDPETWRKRRRRLIAALAAMLVFSSGLWVGNWRSFEPRPLAALLRSSNAPGVSLEGVSIRIGSKSFTEQKILGHIAVQVLEAAGAEVTGPIEAGTTKQLRELLVDGYIDAYFEYTGTVWVEILGETSRFPDSAADDRPVDVFRAVRAEDAQNGIAWFALSEANSAYAIAASENAVKAYDLDNQSNIFDYAKIAEDDPAKGALCITPEFRNRKGDGLTALREYLDLGAGHHQVAVVGDDAVPDEVAAGNSCNFGVVFLNSAGIEAHDLMVLEDDFFLPYNIAMCMRLETYRTHSAAYVTLFNTIGTLLDNKVMERLNRRVEIGGEDPAEVAESFLESRRLI